MKKCKTCGEEKPFIEFAKCKRCINGVRGDCKKCQSKKSTEYQKLNPEERKEYLKNWYENNPDKVKKQRDCYRDIKNKKRREKYEKDEEYRKQRLIDAKNWQTNNPEKRKNQRLKAYGIDYESFINLLKDANNKCEICGYSDIADKKMFPVVDHCHSSNKVRGILCSKCNMALGNFNDSIKNLHNAIKYLTKKGKNNAS